MHLHTHVDTSSCSNAMRIQLAVGLCSITSMGYRLNTNNVISPHPQWRSESGRFCSPQNAWAFSFLVVDHVPMNQKTALGVDYPKWQWKGTLVDMPMLNPQHKPREPTNHVLNRVIDYEIWPTQRFPPRNPRKSDKDATGRHVGRAQFFSVASKTKLGDAENTILGKGNVLPMLPDDTLQKKKQERYSALPKTNSSPSRMHGWEMKFLSFFGAKKKQTYFQRVLRRRSV